MKAGPDIAMVASLVGDPARSNMLTALMTGRALTASELAHQKLSMVARMMLREARNAATPHVS